MLGCRQLSAWRSESARVVLPPSPLQPPSWTPTRGVTRQRSPTHTSCHSQQWSQLAPTPDADVIVSRAPTTQTPSFPAHSPQAEPAHLRANLSRRTSLLLACAAACHHAVGGSQPAHASGAATAKPTPEAAEASVLLAPAPGSTISPPSQVADAKLIKGSFRYTAKATPECKAAGKELTAPQTPASGNQRRRPVVVSEPPAHCTDQGLQVNIRLRVPHVGATAPVSSQSLQHLQGAGLVAVLIPGFSVDPAAYRSYLDALLAVQVPVVEYSVPQTATAPLNDVCCAEVLQHVLDWSDQQPELQQFIAASAPQASRQGAQYVLIGHSRGAKISALVAAGVGAPSEGSAQAQSNSASAVLPVPDQGSALAAQQHAGGGISSDGVGGGSGVNQGVSSKARGDRVAGLILIDPADASYEQVEGPRYPSAVKLLASQHPAPQGSATDVPILLIGAGRNGDCIPRRGNYLAFFNATQHWSSPAALVTLPEAGHFAYLDMLTPLQESVCSLGRANAASVRKAVAALMQQWVGLCAQWADKQPGAQGTLASVTKCSESIEEALHSSLGANGVEFKVELRMPR